MDGSGLPAIAALPSCDALSKAPRAAGYRGSDFVLLKKADIGAPCPQFSSFWHKASARQPSMVGAR